MSKVQEANQEEILTLLKSIEKRLNKLEPQKNETNGGPMYELCFYLAGATISVFFMLALAGGVYLAIDYLHFSASQQPAA